ncbi:MAG: hypothetical protein JKY19_05100 [Alcanivoracaceae bacterium]|nr:hypothetical protein [Alcanivoracaceae bacterium]
MKNKIILATMLLASNVTFAGLQWSGIGVVTSVMSQDGYTVITTTINSNNCGFPGKFAWESTTIGDKDLMSIALVAINTSLKFEVANQSVSTDAQCYLSGELIKKSRISR